MNTIAWTITLAWNITLKDKFSFNVIKNLTNKKNSNLFIYGKTDLKSSIEILEFLKKSFEEEVLSYDISISTEDKIKLFEEDLIDGEYSTMTISWLGEDFESVLETFVDSDSSIVSIREVEDSKIFDNRKVRIDFIN